MAHIQLKDSSYCRLTTAEHWRKQYLYLDHPATDSLTVIDISDPTQPRVIKDLNRGHIPGAVGLMVGDTGLIISSAVDTALKTVSIVSFADPQNPKLQRIFTNVSGFAQKPDRGLIFIVNDEGLWILQQHPGPDVELEKEYGKARCVRSVKTNKRDLLRSLYSLIAIFLCVSRAFGSAATFVTALPVAQDQLLLRFNAQPNFSTRSFSGVQFPVNIGYGLTSRWALFLNVNQGFGSQSSVTAAGSTRLSSSGAGDQLFYARFTLFKIDKPRSTFRIAPLAGAFLPTGDNSLSGPQGLLPKALQTGSGTLDPYVGVAIGYNTVRWGMALDSTYRLNPKADQGISPGSQYRSDAQVEYKLYPVHMPAEGLPKLLVLSIESNYVHDQKDHVNGLVSANSGGNTLKQDAILEISTLHWQVGMGAQIPVMQDLVGVGRMKQRSGLFLFFEYYLAAPSRHRAAVQP